MSAALAMPEDRPAMRSIVRQIAAAPRIGEAAPDDRLVTIDFEASCLPAAGSYPIEVAACRVATGEVRSWLIRPTESWRRTGRWEREAEELHGISQETLQKDGLAVEQVRRELASFVGHRAVSDAPLVDGYWLDVLYHGEPPFVVRGVDDVLTDRDLFPITASPAEVRLAERRAMAQFPIPHRAASDCQRIAAALQALFLAGTLSRMQSASGHLFAVEA